MQRDGVRLLLLAEVGDGRRQRGEAFRFVTDVTGEDLQAASEENHGHAREPRGVLDDFARGLVVGLVRDRFVAFFDVDR